MKFFLILILFGRIYGHSYVKTTYNSENFFESFLFESIDDPTHGTVQYINYTTAVKHGLAKIVNNSIYLGVDDTNVLKWPQGRMSLRLKSKRVLNGNLIVVIDLKHMPSTAGKILPKGCSVWPAFWSFGPDWPNNGEINIIEYVNKNSNVTSTLHTGKNCSMFNSSNEFTGSQTTKDCYTYAAGQGTNAGCGFHGNNIPVGAKFNAQTGGGIYVMEWDNSQYIRMFYFPRNSIPSDIKNKNPDPSKWGLPYARFDISMSCDSNCQSSHFQNHNLILDTTLCGDWAGNDYVFGASCSATMKCDTFVRNNPSEFSEAYWLINYIDIYDNRRVPKKVRQPHECE